MEAFMATDRGKNILNLKDNLNTLEDKLKRLSSREADLKEKVTKAEQTEKKKSKREVQNWFKEVKQTEDEFDSLKSLIHVGDCVAKLEAKVEQLMEQSQTQHFKDPLADDHDYRGDPLVTTELFGGKFKEVLTTICNLLVTNKFFNIGIYGQGGVGKTTLAKHIHNHLLETTDFKVSWVTVSQESSIKKLQEDIAKLVKLDLSGEDNEDLRAARLSRSLAHQQSVLILDDVWKEFFLENIGIALGANKCRLILTTRSLQLCDRMRCQRKFDVKTLDRDEAWDLFKYTLGLETVLIPEVEKTAKKVAKRCAGLPLGIIVVAGSMRGVVDISEWRDVLYELESWSVGFTEMEEKVFPILEWSFTRLKGCARHCFLYCCLYPEDCYIEREELINLFILAKLIPRRKSRQSKHDCGRKILNKLVKACLLEAQDFDGRECIKMHDLIRVMALRITHGKSTREMKGDVPRFLVSGRERNVIVKESEWTENLNAVSTFYHGSIEIPPKMSPNCQNLSTLIFQNVKIERIPDLFFSHMKGLKVLNLRGCNRLKKLPISVSELENLTALLLGGCIELESVPALGTLKKLRELDLSYTNLDDIPQGLELLIKLERLNMVMTILKEKIIPKGTFTNLNRLQHLVLDTSVQVCEPQVLKQLQVFSGCITLDVYIEFMTFGCLPKHYAISFVDVPSYYRFSHFNYKYNNHRNTLDFGECKSEKGLDLVLIPKDIQELVLSKCFRLSDGNLYNLIRRSKDLVCLRILYSEEVDFLFNFSSPSPSHVEHQLVVLPNLRQLWLKDLPNFVGLRNWGRQQQQQQLIPPPPPTPTFSSLTFLCISGCHRLKKLFTVQLLSQQHSLQNLEQLRIVDCEQVEEMIAGNDNDEGMGEEIVIHPFASSSSSSTVRLPKLKHLWLRNLPQLENKNCKAISIISDSIKEIWVEDCPKLKRLPLYIPINNINTTNAGNGQTSSFSAPPTIYGSKGWWESLEWDHYPPNSKDALLPSFLLRNERIVIRKM